MRRAHLASALLATGLLIGARPLGPPDETADLLITGRVTTAAGGALSGANVQVVSAQLSTGTDPSGHYRLVVPARHRGTLMVVRVRAIGYVPVVKQVLLDRDSLLADFTLTQDVNRLSQVVVTTTRGANYSVAAVTAAMMPVPGASALLPGGRIRAP